MKKFITGIKLLGCAAAVAGLMFCYWGYGMLADAPGETTTTCRGCFLLKGEQ